MNTTIPRSHRAATSPVLTPGQRLAARIAAFMTILWAAAFTAGNTGRNPAAGLADVIWTVPTPTALAAGAVVVAVAVLFRKALNAPKGNHRRAV